MGSSTGKKSGSHLQKQNHDYPALPAAVSLAGLQELLPFLLLLLLLAFYNVTNRSADQLSYFILAGGKDPELRSWAGEIGIP